MARPRTPTNVLALRGAFDKDPKRGVARENEPQPNGDVGDPPIGQTVAVHDAWKAIVECCAPGVLCKSDRIALQIAAVLLAEFNGNAAEMPAARIARLDSLLSRFGMTPSDRSKVSVPNVPKQNAFSGLVRKGR